VSATDQSGSGEGKLVAAPAHWIAARPPQPTPPPRTRSLRSVASVAQVVFATEAGPPPESRLHWLCAEVDDFLNHAGTRSRLIFWAALFVVIWLSPLLVLRPPPLGLWPLSVRTRALERLERTPLALVLLPSRRC
jgi:hypothetical protein